MHRKYAIIGMIVSLFLLWFVINAGFAFAEIGLGGKIESSLITTVDPGGDLTTTWLEHLNLEFLLPKYGDTSAKLEFGLYYDPQNKLGFPGIGEELSLPAFKIDVTKLYVKHRFDGLHLTLGRQPVSWTFGSMLNPVDFRVNRDLISMAGQEMSENAIYGYIPLDWASNLTVIAAFPEMAKGTKIGIRGRTHLQGFDLTMNYVREAESSLIDLNPTYKQRLGLTAKGDAGPIGIYGAIGYNYNDHIVQGKPVYLLGADYSFNIGYGSKLFTQIEYLRDEAYVIQSELLGPVGSDLLIGMLGYEIDEFAGLALMGIFNPKDQSLVLGPEYHNLIGTNLDLSIRGGIFLGSRDSQFGPKKIGKIVIPKGMIQVSVSYPF